jgi:hypothetical protein
MKTINTLTSKTANFEKKVMYVWHWAYGIEIGTRKDYLQAKSYPGALRFISKHIDMFAGTQQERQLHIRNVIIARLKKMGLAKETKDGIDYLVTDKFVTL